MQPFSSVAGSMARYTVIRGSLLASAQGTSENRETDSGAAYRCMSKDAWQLSHAPIESRPAVLVPA
jgi:hypothetical protein